ncbi:GntR family transcriptional regulator [Alkalicoccobacillus porphyridii]|uniref:GntR family transcriptional regulator n=1 Tax=Alkalicoccobacillus porphyridii TaxID=2597270 RepID=A0A554A1U9_9BACI|nr:GntR family transcriptional regulator [Alkalicoccobacillus porphyridii]TSB47663.1 GntR family transcriptional regulator [Alkalicoccobacillus porphyridii]
MYLSKAKVSTRDFVYDTIHDLIMTLELAPGKAISEKDIADELQVSRTPVREAFLRLSEDELLHVLPQRGSFVTLIDASHVEDARFVREHTEAAIIRLACSSFDTHCMNQLESNLTDQKVAKVDEDEDALFSLDKEFHRLLAEGTNKIRVWEVNQRMNVHLNRLRKLSMHSKMNWELLIEQHEALIEAVKMGKADIAEQLMRHHLTLLQYDQAALKEKYPHYFSA